MADRLTTSLQESVLTLICMNDQEGAIAAGLVDVELFEPPYDEIVSKAVDFHRKFKRAPGESHIDDLFDQVLSNPKHRHHKLYQNILGSVLEASRGLNATYILSRINDFQRQQHLKASVLEAAQKYEEGGVTLIADVESILHKALKFKHEGLDAGTFLGDKNKALAFLNSTSLTYQLGIPEFDRRQIGPTQGQALAFMARKGAGKSWFCIHAGLMGLLQDARVVHISLEMSEEEVSKRYLQRMFAVSKRRETYNVTELKKDSLERVIDLNRMTFDTELSLDDPRIGKKLRSRMEAFGTRLNRIVVKRFPTNGLTTRQLEAYLDGLELTTSFVPTMLIVDYPDLMLLDPRQDLRVAVGTVFKELRGLCVERNLAGLFPIQSNRAGEDATVLGGKHIGEDYSKGQTADMLITYNQTKMEKSLGLARLWVDKARGDEDGFTILVTQNYKTGQFVRESAYVPGKYWDRVKETADEE